jgi:hypothetical protein
MGFPLWPNWHTLPLYAKQLVGIPDNTSQLSDSQIQQIRHFHHNFKSRDWQVPQSETHTVVQVPVLIFTLKLWSSQHLHNKKSVTQKHTHLVEATQDHKEMSHFSFTQTHTYKRKVVPSPIGDIVQLYFYIFVLFRFVSPMQRRDTCQCSMLSRDHVWRKQSLFTFKQ